MEIMLRAVNVHKLAVLHNARGFFIAFPNLGWRIGFQDKDGAVVFVTRGHVLALPNDASVPIDEPNTVFRNLGGIKFRR